MSLTLLQLQRCYVGILYLLVLLLLILAGLKGMALAFTFQSTKDFNEVGDCFFYLLPPQLDRSPIKLVFATSLISLLCCFGLVSYSREMTGQYKSMALTSIWMQCAVLSVTIALATMSIVSVFVAQASSVPIDFSGCFFGIAEQVYDPGVVDLETWACGVKEDLLGIEKWQTAHTLCSTETAGRIGTVLVFCATTIALLLVIIIRAAQSVLIHQKDSEWHDDDEVSLVGVEYEMLPDQRLAVPPPYRSTRTLEIRLLHTTAMHTRPLTSPPANSRISSCHTMTSPVSPISPISPTSLYSLPPRPPSSAVCR